MVILFILALASPLAAADLTGTWRLNSEKSKLVAEYASDIITIVQIGPLSYRMIYDVVLKAGEKFHSEVVRIFDGKSRPVQGSEGINEINDHPDDVTWRSRRIKDGKVIDERSAAITGSTQTVQRTTVNASGETVKEVLVFERQ